MPGYKVHIVAGMVTPVVFAFTANSIIDVGLVDITLIGGVLASSIGSIAPDIDADYSKIRHMLPGLARAYDKLPKNAIFKHRGIACHSVVTVLALFTVWFRFPNWLTLGFMLGVASHHLLDGLTAAGLPNYFLTGGKR